MAQAEALDLLKQAMALARAGDKARALPLLRQLVEQDAGDEPAWMWLASVAESPQEALSALEHVLALNPQNDKARSAAHAARLQLGVAAAKAAKKPRARVLLRAVVAAEPENELAWMWLANVAESPAAAAACLEKVLAVNPDNELARTTLERCLAAVRPSGYEDPVAPSAAASQAATPRRPIVDKTVWVVEGDAPARAEIASAIEDRGYKVRAAADGYEAIELLRDHGVPDLILLSLRLPGGMDGYQLCKLLREHRGAGTPILLLTEVDSIVGKVRSRLAGATAELLKPFTAEGLMRAVASHCPADAAL